MRLNVARWLIILAVISIILGTVWLTATFGIVGLLTGLFGLWLAKSHIQDMW